MLLFKAWVFSSVVENVQFDIAVDVSHSSCENIHPSEGCAYTLHACAVTISGYLFLCLINNVFFVDTDHQQVALLDIHFVLF